MAHVEAAKPSGTRGFNAGHHDLSSEQVGGQLVSSWRRLANLTFLTTQRRLGYQAIEEADAAFIARRWISIPYPRVVMQNMLEHLKQSAALRVVSQTARCTQQYA